MQQWHCTMRYMVPRGVTQAAGRENPVVPGGCCRVKSTCWLLGAPMPSLSAAWSPRAI